MLSNETNLLSASVAEFKRWVSDEIILKNINLISNEGYFDIVLSRRELMIICGNISKHNITNLSHKIKALNGHINPKYNISNEDVTISLLELYDKFCIDYLEIQTTIWAELLNNVRIGILQYLKPIFIQSIVYDTKVKGKYYYKYPDNISSPLAKNFFWNLMNRVRTNFYIKDFVSSEIMKKVNKKQVYVSSVPW